MNARLRLVLLLVGAVAALGATSSSYSRYSIEFPGNALGNEQAVAYAIAVLHEEGYRTLRTGPPARLQLEDSPVWVEVTAPSPGTLEMAFTQLRGGCGHAPEVVGSRAAAEKVRAKLASVVGSAKTQATHQANALGEAQ
jgi:hypothetical protein